MEIERPDRELHKVETVAPAGRWDSTKRRKTSNGMDRHVTEASDSDRKGFNLDQVKVERHGEEENPQDVAVVLNVELAEEHGYGVDASARSLPFHRKGRNRSQDPLPFRRGQCRQDRLQIMRVR